MILFEALGSSGSATFRYWILEKSYAFDTKKLWVWMHSLLLYQFEVNSIRMQKIMYGLKWSYHFIWFCWSIICELVTCLDSKIQPNLLRHSPKLKKKGLAAWFTSYKSLACIFFQLFIIQHIRADPWHGCITYTYAQLMPLYINLESTNTSMVVYSKHHHAYHFCGIISFSCSCIMISCLEHYCCIVYN